MLYDENAVRANLRSRDGKRVYYLGKGDQLTSGARDFLRRERIEILPAEQARPERYQTLGGGWLEEKPEHMTHLHGSVLVPKNHPRIQFRGKLDTLEAELLLCQTADAALTAPVGEILNLARQIVRCEVLEEPLRWDKLCGLTEAEQRKRSHFPQDYYGQPHFMPEASDGRKMAQLNLARAASREAELAAAAAFTDADGRVTRPDLLRAMNRLSSAIYLLMIRQKGKEGTP